MKCPDCSSNNRVERRFCHQCGTKLFTFCPFCGFANIQDEAYCGGCGKNPQVQNHTHDGSPAQPSDDAAKMQELLEDSAGQAATVPKKSLKQNASQDDIDQLFGGRPSD